VIRIARAAATKPRLVIKNGSNAVLFKCFADCEACHRDAVFNVAAYRDSVPVPAFGPRMVCTRCGMIGADARPNWAERELTRTAR